MLGRFYVILVILTSLGINHTNAQVVLVDKAYDYLKKNDPQKAREFIDIASVDKTTADDPKTWYLKGFIYAELYRKSPEQNAALREQALEFVSKSIRLDEKGLYTKDCRSVLDFLCQTYFNDAVDAFNATRYAEALTGFKRFLASKPDKGAGDDYTEALYYAGHTAFLLHDKGNAKIYLGKAQSLQYHNPVLYEELATIYQQEGKDRLALQLIESGRRQFPEDKGLQIAEINGLLALGELIKAESLVEKLLVAEPKNVDALLVAGTLYGKISQADSAHSTVKPNAQILARQESTFNRRKAIYQRVLTLQPNNFTANYNLGIILYNRSIDLVNSQNFDVDAIKLHSILEKTTSLFKEALPYMNKANQLAPNDKNTMMALEGIYYNLNEKEKSAQMRVKIDSLN